jgi:DNA-binding transcriptional regulator YhcF (GntR family)
VLFPDEYYLENRDTFSNLRRFTREVTSSPFGEARPNRYDIATEMLSSAIRVLQAAGFEEDEIPELFAKVAAKRVRGPLYIEPLAD